MYLTNFTKTYELKKLSLDSRFVKFNYENWLVKLGHENKKLECISQILLKHMNLKN